MKIPDSPGAGPGEEEDRMSLLWILLAVLLVALIVGMWRPWTVRHTHTHDTHDHV